MINATVATLGPVSAPNRVFLARLAGVPVLDPNGDPVGKVRDVIATLRVGNQPPRVLGLVVAVMAGSWALRQTTSLSVLRDRAPNFVRLSDGGVRNGYALKLGDKTRGVESYALVLDAPAGLQMLVQDAALDAQGRPVLTTRPDGITQWRALLTAPPGLKLPENVPVTFKLLDAQGRAEVAVRQARSRLRQAQGLLP